MSKQFLDEVKDQLASQAQRTTLQALQHRGLQKVRVIRSSQILQLIDDAVDRAMAEQGLIADAERRSEVQTASQEIFQGMVQEGIHSDRALLDEYRAHQEELEGQLRGMQEALEQKTLESQSAEARAAELNAELQVLHQRQQAANPDALLDELRALRHEIGQQPAPVQPMESGANQEAISEHIANLGKELGKEIERIGRKVGVSSAEETAADLSGLFNNTTDIDVESNMDTVQAEERKGSDVDQALARMRSLRGKK